MRKAGQRQLAPLRVCGAPLWARGLASARDFNVSLVALAPRLLLAYGGSTSAGFCVYDSPRLPEHGRAMAQAPTPWILEPEPHPGTRGVVHSERAGFAGRGAREPVRFFIQNRTPAHHCRAPACLFAHSAPAPAGDVPRGAMGVQ